jgi:hypothetical protein
LYWFLFKSQKYKISGNSQELARFEFTNDKKKKHVDIDGGSIEWHQNLYFILTSFFGISNDTLKYNLNSNFMIILQFKMFGLHGSFQ